MQLSPQQLEAKSAVTRWLQAPTPVFRLFGYAGTGKTTIARELAREAGTTLFAAFTGKAALVLQKKGCYPASTIHKLIYSPKERSRSELLRLRRRMVRLVQEEAEQDKIDRLQEQIDREEKKLKQPTFDLREDSELKSANLLVVDEVSMVDGKIADDLMSFGVPILALGDPAQLDPVRGSGFFIKEKPDFLLTEIHRQAEGSPIIDLATTVRTGRRLEYGEYGESAVVKHGTLPISHGLDYDQILVGTNKRRVHVNNRCRELLGRRSALPETGDKLICTRNDHEVGLLNGSLWVCRSDAEVVDDDTILLHVESVDTKQAESFTAHSHPFEGREIPHWLIREEQCFDYAYAITTHKAQGSQWPSVLVVDESDRFSSPKKWLYTAITRAADRVTIVR